MIQLNSKFLQFTLTADEAQLATQLSSLQFARLHNELTDRVDKRLSLRLDPNNVAEFTQQEAYLIGQIELLEQLLADAAPSSQPAVPPT